MATLPPQQQPYYDIPVVVTFVVKVEAPDSTTATAQALAEVNAALVTFPFPDVNVSAGTVTSSSIVTPASAPGTEVADAGVVSPE